MITSVLFGSPITVLSNVVGTVESVTNRFSSNSVSVSSSIGTNTHVLLTSGSMDTVILLKRKSTLTAHRGRGGRDGEGREGGKKGRREEGGRRKKGREGCSRMEDRRRQRDEEDRERVGPACSLS